MHVLRQSVLAALAAGSAFALSAPAVAQEAVPESIDVTAPGPAGPLAGSLIDAGEGAPVVLIIPGSGPTDRNGDNPMMNAGGYLRVLAERLATAGVGSVRIDKRGMFASAGAVADPAADSNMAGYIDDTRSWIDAIRARTGAPCVWILGHSEGGLVALESAQVTDGICGLILVETAGRPLGAVIREQFRANPANAPLLAQLMGLADAWEAGGIVDPATLHPAIARLFPEATQRYFVDLAARDPAVLAANYAGPMLIVQGTRDIQVREEDAAALRAARPDATLLTIEGMNHLLKHVDSDDRAANLATYGDPDVPVVPEVASGIADFVLAHRDAR